MESKFRGTVPSVASAIALLLGTTALTSLSTPALAQDGGEALEEVVVTGSRIVRRDFTASSPIVTVDSDAFDRISTIGVESTLNRMPQFIPGNAGGGPGSGTQFGTTDVQAGAANTPGISTVNLRGLGTFRNLVLFDGRRAQPSNGLLVVDVNTIPSAAIDSVEVISGGASATYGADAVSGVVNFKLKKDFEGLNLDVQRSLTEDGGGAETRVSALVGGNFGDNRGNVMFGGEYAKRQAIKSSSRKWQREIWEDPLNTTGQAPADTYITGLGGGPAMQAAYDNIFSEVPAGTVTAGADVYVNDDGTLYVPSNTPIGAVGYTGPVDGRHIKIGENGNVVRNDLFSLISSPMERYSAFGRGTYEITDDIRFFIQGNFSDVKVDQILAYSPATQFWSATIPHDAAHPVPAELEALLNARTRPAREGDPEYDPDAEVQALVSNADAPWTLNRDLDFLGPRRSSNETTLYQLMVGFDGNLPIGDWTYEVYGSHGKTSVVSRLQGFASLERYRAMLNQPNYGKGTTNLGSNSMLGFIGTCTSGLPVFEDFEISDDCVGAVGSNMKQTTTLKQDVAEANIQGGIFDLPAGELRGAFGASYRKNTLVFEPDTLLDADSFLDQPTGLFASNQTQGSTNVKEIYGELLVPLISNTPGIQRLELEIGGRISDYNTSGTIETYKALGNWTVNDYVNLRGGYQLANRAPNVAELYQGKAQSVVGFPLSDPCLSNTLATWGNQATNPDRAQVIGLCKQLNAPGVFYNQGDNALNWAGPFGGRFPLELGVVVGNPDLKSEKAKTITLGGVVRSPFEGEMVSDITATVDFYQIKISDTIAPTDAVAVYQDCFNGFGNNPGYDPNYISCTYITRDNLGYRLSVDTPYVNTGKLTTRGLDFTVNWAFPLGDLGRLNVNYQGNYLLTFKAQDTPQTPALENRGTFGQGGQFRYKSNTTFSFFRADWGVGLRWRHLSGIKDASYVTNPDTTILPVGAYDIFDAFGNWGITETVALRFGIDNLLDKQPPRTGVDPGNNNGLGTNAGYYDVIGRRYYAGLNLTF